MERKRREIVKGRRTTENMERERYENEQRTFFFFFLACHFLKPVKFVWDVPKWKCLRGKKIGKWEFFLTSPTFDCTPGYAPEPRPKPTLNPSLLQRSSISLFPHEIHCGYPSQKILNYLTDFPFKVLVFFVFLEDKGLQCGCSINEYGGCHFIVIPFLK